MEQKDYSYLCELHFITIRPLQLVHLLNQTSVLENKHQLDVRECEKGHNSFIVSCKVTFPKPSTFVITLLIPGHVPQ